MTPRDIVAREKEKFKTYPITGTLSFVLFLLISYHVILGA